MDQIVGTIGKWSSYFGYSLPYNTQKAPPGKNVNTNEFNSVPLCFMCSEPLTQKRDPRILTCKHAFCFKCLAQIEYGSVIKCPQCNNSTVLDGEISTLDKLMIDDFPEENEVDKKTMQYLSKSFVDVPLTAEEQRELALQRQFEEDQNNPELIEAKEEGFVVVDKTPVGLVADQYIPFTQKKELCKTLLTQWISSIWFPPSDLNESLEIMDSRPCYVPFYCFTVTTHTVYQAELGTTQKDGMYNDAHITYIEGIVLWNPVTGAFSTKYDELIVCASYSVNRDLVHKLLRTRGSFSLNTDRVLPTDAIAFQKADNRKSVNLGSEELLSIDVNSTEAFKILDFKGVVEQAEVSRAKKEIKHKYKPEQRRNLKCKTKLHKMEHSIILLPIYFTSFKYNNTEYEVCISGNKGVVEGNRPFGSGFIGKTFRDAMKKVSSN